MDFESHSEVNITLEQIQKDERDQRDQSREAHVFIDKRDGQWEQGYWDQCDGSPRYTFDLANQVVNQATGEIAQAEFAISVDPSGGEATDEIAEIFEGMSRNIEGLSDAKDIYNEAAQDMVVGGLSGWVVKQKYVDQDSFDQDLVIEPVANYLDSVWLDSNSMKQDGSDATYAFVLQGVGVKEYKEKYPDGSGMSVGQGKTLNNYFVQRDVVTIGQVYYAKTEEKKLLKLSDGRLVNEDEVAPVMDELLAQGVTVVAERSRSTQKFMSRLFDGGDWLGPAEETVFTTCPVIPVYGHYKTYENKRLYRGEVETIMDPCRVFNYVKSRELAEGAMSPRAKYWMTDKQANGHELELATLNTNNEPVQLYNHDPDVPGRPEQSGGIVVNNGLRGQAEDMRALVGQSAGLFAASMGDNPGLQSGVAIKELQHRGSLGMSKNKRSMEIAICRTAKLLIQAIPRVYTENRTATLLKEDGQVESVQLNQSVIDEQTGALVKINDLSLGKYSVTCSAGKSFAGRQEETVAAMIEVAGIEPSVLQVGADVLFNNISAPGMKIIAERKRLELFNAGMIPPEQMTEEERQQAEVAAQQPQQPDPNMVLAQAEVGKAEAQTNKVNVDAQVAERREAREDFKAQNDARLDQQKFEQQQKTNEFEALMATQQQQAAAQAAILDAIQTQAETLKILREAMGVDAITGPGNTNAYIEQAELVNEAQEEL